MIAKCLVDSIAFNVNIAMFIAVEIHLYYITTDILIEHSACVYWLKHCCTYF